jgi:1A family penicillin-binding protein
MKRKRLLRLLIPIGCALILMGVGLYIWLFHDLPPIDRLQAGMQLPSTRIYDRHGQLLYEVLAGGGTGGLSSAIDLDAIPRHCVNAAIATEDANYYAHPGIDLIGILRAAWANLRGGEVVAGGSTITQQVVRNLLLDPQERAERTLTRKLREMILALRLQAAYSKDDVLALYLNQSYFGNLAYGIDAAARAYFGRFAAELSLAECAMLIGLLQAPAVYDPLTNPGAADARQEVVLNLMAQNGFITQIEAETAARDELQFAASPFSIQAPHFVMAVLKQLERSYPDELLRGGLRVITTLDLAWQNTAQRIVNNALASLNHPNDPARPAANANNAALVALDPRTGQIYTMLGSPDYFNEDIDGAVNAALALRQPGSALKPFTYAAAMNPSAADPWTAATMILDVRTPFVTRRLESYTPLNFGLVEHGPVSAREALASSLNIPAVIALEHAGIGAMVELAANAGLATLAANTNIDLAVTLGGGEVRLLDLTAAYSIFANGGWRVDPVYILRVENAAGELLYEWQPAPPSVRVIDERLAWLITDILSDDEARMMGFGRNSAMNIGRPAAAKTGTTTDFRDNWIVGYTPELVTGVWVGNADNTPMRSVTGVSGAAPIWNQFMRAVLRGQPETAFVRPDGLVRREVCIPSGLLPTPRCPRTRPEWFIEGTEPTAADNLYQEFILDRATGLLADEDTPVERRVRQVFALYPQEAREWAIRQGIPQPPERASALTPVRMPDAERGLRLLSPDPYTIFEISPILPIEAQRIRFAVGVPPGTQRVTYELDGVGLPAVESAPWSLWWTLELGEHTLIAHAETPDGLQTSAPLHFRVVADAPLGAYTRNE